MKRKRRRRRRKSRPTLSVYILVCCGLSRRAQLPELPELPE